jgi:hypothetical protein
MRDFTLGDAGCGPPPLEQEPIKDDWHQNRCGRDGEDTALPTKKIGRPKQELVIVKRSPGRETEIIRMPLTLGGLTEEEELLDWLLNGDLLH